mmetsp:Transcript_5866/g.12698  ORF Transcript_5866/g.12698 Transcript_5866/m.12698 type:complete len:309 (+) Transcript_5866:154-1080(+)
MIVVLGKSRRMLFCTASWVTGSRADVHSSSSKTGGWRITMRARLMSCFCPKLTLLPSRSTWVSRPSGKVRMNCISCTLCTASQMRASGNSSKGSRLKRIVPSKMVGSCGTRPTMRRTARKPSLALSRPPIRMRPLRASRKRRMQSKVVDLPQPVLPTKAHLEHGGIWRVTPCSTLLAVAYPAVRSSISTLRPPWNSVFQRSSQIAAGGLQSSRAICSAEPVTLLTAMTWKLPLPCSSVKASLLGANSQRSTPLARLNAAPSALASKSTLPPAPRRHTCTPDPFSLTVPCFICRRMARSRSTLTCRRTV